MGRHRSIGPRLAGLALLAGLASACASPVGIATERPRAVHRYLTQNALSAGEPSTFSLA